MDRFSERVTRPTLSTPERNDDASAREPMARPSQPSRNSEKTGKKFTKKSLLGIAGIIALLALIWWFFLRNIGVPSYVDTGKYQVVCLQSGECYFGKITSVSSDMVQIKNVFYVQKSTDTATDTTKPANENNLQLIKLGNEVHGPEDMMAINRSQVLYIENLKSDGKVTQTITSYYQQNK